LTEVERIVRGKPVHRELAHLARKAATAAIQPIDDIRSTARYRSAVAGNLVAEFVEQLGTPGSDSGKTA
jgi:putative cofactor-binding repeat protein